MFFSFFASISPFPLNLLVKSIESLALARKKKLGFSFANRAASF
jgi:hypothetical protein